MNSPRATETAVRIVKTLETLTRINKITSVNSMSNNSASHRRRHPAQHYTHLRHDGNVFRTLPFRRVRTFLRTPTMESMESMMEPTSTSKYCFYCNRIFRLIAVACSVSKIARKMQS